MYKAAPYQQLFRVAPRAQGQIAENGRRIGERNNQLYFKPNNSANKMSMAMYHNRKAFVILPVLAKVGNHSYHASTFENDDQISFSIVLILALVRLYYSA
ncbi:hypothetical protein N7537_008888 [Penicillium hordei]|uniref:Uncharacterized protein n=1 Tax=Penicillium hordei TaxID=40994 RepID=A0AAD6H189_9EURO|nr:uncharacterized protein N7537_008888 [Penicillium hordei]KAJ5598804.1 hypothetical protein N7537_008888 [Penicillium hordei]